MDTNTPRTILIVSDDSEATAARKALFEQKDCAVIWETSPVAAPNTAQVLAPSLIIVDLSLPHAEIVFLCRELRAATEAKILLLSPTKDDREIYEYYLAGVDEHLSTPLAPMMLMIKCMAWLVRQDWLVEMPAQFQHQDLYVDHFSS